MMRTKMEAGGCNYAVNSPMFLDSFQDLSITPSPHTRLVTFLTRSTLGSGQNTEIRAPPRTARQTHTCFTLSDLL